MSITSKNSSVLSKRSTYKELYSLTFKFTAWKSHLGGILQINILLTLEKPLICVIYSSVDLNQIFR